MLAVCLAAGLGAVGCGGGSHTYKAGTPAVTGVPPDCSVVPLDLFKKLLKLDVTGPLVDTTKPHTTICTFPHGVGGGGAVEQVRITGDETPENFHRVRDGLKAANNPVKKIGGWGDEAYAAAVHFVVVENNFAVRKGQVSVAIQSTADFDGIKKLMKEILKSI
ncbi:MAG TPA: hypothetical protein VHL53_11755 [Acidimicrobiia bacterium]|nr:hypothetical protein [Acidimicrobiia bacterium]